jgi:hypothetical protein
MLSLDSLALRVWTSTTGRKLHASLFAERQDYAILAPRLVMFSSPSCQRYQPLALNSLLFDPRAGRGAL